MLKQSPEYYTKLKNANQQKSASKTKDQLGRKGTQKFITMARVDFAAYEFLCRQYEVKQWIEKSLGETLDEDFWLAVGDGIALCKLANKIWAGSVPKYHPADSYKFKLIDNIGFFLKAIEEHGVDPNLIFRPIDLFEKKNMPLVVKCLQNVAEVAVKGGFPHKIVSVQNLEFTPKQIQDAKKLEGMNEDLSVTAKPKNVDEVFSLNIKHLIYCYKARRKEA